MGDTVKNIVKAAVIVAAVATGVQLFLNPAMGLSKALAFAGRQFLQAAALGAVSAAMTKKPSFPSANDLSGRTISQRNPIISRKVVYGQVKVSGAITFMEATNDNKNLHTVVTLTGHEINAVKEVYFGDQQIFDGTSTDGASLSLDSTTPDFSSKSTVYAHHGSASQSANANLVSDTSADSNFRQRSCAYIYAKLEYDQDIFANGAPNISAVIEGRKVYDPRTSTTAYSNNPALCIRDYLMDTTFGLGATADEIDDDAFEAAADVCDENVTLASGGTEKRYTMNGVVDTANAPNDILGQMVTACAGQIFYANGQWKIKAGEYVTPTDTLTLDDVRGPIKVDTRVSGQAQFNAVKGIFVSPENNWQATDYPEITSEQFEGEDGGERKYVDMTLPYTTSAATAQRLAKQSLYRNREQLIVTLPCKLNAFKYEIGDTVMVTNERFGWDQKVFEVISWTLVPEFSESGGTMGVDLVLKETSAAVYAWDEAVDEQAFTFNNTTLPSAFENPAPGLAVSDELRTLNEEAISVLIANVSGGGGFTQRYEVEAIKAGNTEYVTMGQASGGRFELLNVEDGATYTVRARSINSIGVRSEWASVAHQVVGKTAPPSDVTGLSGNLIGNQYLLTWDAVPDLDLSYYRVRFAAEDGSPTYRNSVSLVPKVSRPATSVMVPARNGTYFVKAVDKLGLASRNPTTIVLSSNIDQLENLNVITTVTEHPDFNGTFDDVVEIDEDDRLVLDTSLLFDAVTGDFDDADGQFDGGSGNVDASGYYYFGNTVDLGAKYLSRVTARLKHTRLEYVNLFDSVTGLFDDRPGEFDGDADAFDDTDAHIEYRVTFDDPAGSPTWSSWQRFEVADVLGRGFEFRCKMTTLDNDASPAVSELSVTVDMPDRVESAQDVSSGAGAKSVTFGTAFKETPSIGIGAQDMQTGDYYEISSKSRAGFTITFKSSGGTAVDRTFDYVATGWGKEIS